MPMTPSEQEQFYHEQRLHDEAALAGGKGSPELGSIYGKLGAGGVQGLGTAGNQSVRDLRAIYSQPGGLSGQPSPAPDASRPGTPGVRTAGPASAVRPAAKSSGTENPVERALVGVNPQDRQMVEDPKAFFARMQQDPAVQALMLLTLRQGTESTEGFSMRGATGGLASRAAKAGYEEVASRAAPLIRSINEEMARAGSTMEEAVTNVANKMGMPIKSVLGEVGRAMRAMRSHVTQRLDDAASRITEARNSVGGAVRKVEAKATASRAARGAGTAGRSTGSPPKPAPLARREDVTYKPSDTAETIRSAPPREAPSKPAEPAKAPARPAARPAATRTTKRSATTSKEAQASKPTKAPHEPKTTASKPNTTAPKATRGSTESKSANKSAWRSAIQKAPKTVGKEKWAQMSKVERDAVRKRVFNEIRGKKPND